MDASLRKVLAESLNNVKDIKLVETMFSKEELFAFVEQSSVCEGCTAKLQRAMKFGVKRPSGVWKWAETSGTSSDRSAMAIGWWERCEELLVHAAKQRRMEISAPSCEDDSLELSEAWVSIGDLEEIQVEIPTSLKQKFEEVIGEIREFTRIQDSVQPEDVTGAIMHAVIDSLGIRKTRGFKARRSTFTADVVFKKRGKTDYDFNDSVVEGVIEYKSFERGHRLHGAALVQAMKYLHLSRKDIGRVGSVWACVCKKGLRIQYRMGIANWEAKTIVATDICHLVFDQGNYVNPQEWKTFFGFIMSMDSVTLCNTREDTAEARDSEEEAIILSHA